MNFSYKFVNKKLPNYLRDMFKYNHEVHDIEPEVMIGFTYTQPAQAVLVTFWDIIYRNY